MKPIVPAPICTKSSGPSLSVCSIRSSDNSLVSVLPSPCYLWLPATLCTNSHCIKNTTYFDYIHILLLSLPPLRFTPTAYQPPNSVSSIHFNNSVSDLCYSSTPGCGAIRWRLANIQVVTSLKKTDCPSPRSHHLSMASKFWEECYEPLSFQSKIFTSLLLCRHCAGSKTCCELMSLCYVRRHCLAPILTDFSLAIFLPLFHDAPWALIRMVWKRYCSCVWKV